jgi:hypothetical protein
MGRNADLNTPAQYHIFQTYIGYKNGAAVCKHCAKTGTNNTNRIKLHLTECQPYQQFLITQTAERVGNDDSNLVKMILFKRLSVII